MKVKLLKLMLLILGFISINLVCFASYNDFYSKIDNKLNKFFEFLEKRYDSFYVIKVLKRIDRRINKIKSAKSEIDLKLLNYIQTKIEKKIQSLEKNKKYILQPITPEKYQKMLLNFGINVNWQSFKRLRKMYNSSWPLVRKRKGFTHVRIRFKEDVNLPLLKQQIEDSLKAGLIPIIAFGAEKFKQNPNVENLNKAVSLWKKVANFLKDIDYRLSFDLMIEPGKALNKHRDMLLKYYNKVISVIRNTGGFNKYRILFLAPPVRSHPDNLNYLNSIFEKYKNDKYLMAEFHFFAAGPSRTSKYLRRTTGTPQEKKKILSKIILAYNWQNKTGRKIWFGAWMPGNYNHTFDKGNNYYSIDEQIKFSIFMVKILSKYHIPSAINADTQFFDRKNYRWKYPKTKVIDEIIKNGK